MGPLRVRRVAATAATAAATGILLAWAGVAATATDAPRPGSLDTSFARHGISITTLPGSHVFVGGIADAGNGGGFFVGANTGGPPANIIGGRLLLLRYNGHGRLVRRFGNRGVASHSLPQGPATVAAVARQPDGRLVVVGSVKAPGAAGNRSVLVARLTQAGALDTSFSGDGIATTDLPGIGDAGTDIAIQPDGRLVVVGFVDPDFSTTGRRSDMIVLRYRSTGDLDTEFGTGGVVRGTDDAGGLAIARSVAIQRNGSILVGGAIDAGQDGTQATLTRLLPDGSFDPAIGSFGLPGTVAAPGSASSIADIALDRKRARIYLIGTRQADTARKSDFYLAALRPNLTVDSSFGARGIAYTHFPRTTVDFATSVRVASRGRVIVAGSAAKPPSGAFALARYTTAGRLDRQFGTGGRALVKVGPGWNVARVLAPQPHGKMLAAGNNRRDPSTETGPAIEIVRLHGG
jgi:uncharacterized delta-60 repeat protein